MCECYQIGGRFIAEDPDCPIHGTEAQQTEQQAYDEKNRLFDALDTLDSAIRTAEDLCDIKSCMLWLTSLLRGEQ